ncbi:histidine phosphatase family protein [Candidatus Chlorohelix sp.]|uniref:histidine phosphatase family protein n=1 Tax=Candidatus Chlorohelix sp. TaxID=3139201 RepID=UPI003025B733
MNNQGKFNYSGLHTEPEGLSAEEIGAGGTIWLARHGEVYNPSAIFYGRMPRFGLSATGRKEAAITGKFLCGQPIEAAYSSPLLRARQTIAIMAKCYPHLQLRQSKLLLEVRTQYQGRLQSELGDYNFYEPIASPDDEDLNDVLARVLTFFKRTLKEYHGKQVLAVSHGDPVVVTHAHFVGLPIKLASIRQPNLYPQHASITRYDFPPEGYTEDISRVRVSYYHPPDEFGKS